MLAGRMALRRRLSIIAAASVGIAIFIAAVACYAVVRGQLYSSVDSSLNAQKAAIEDHSLQLGQSLPVISASAGGPAQYEQVVLGAGRTYKYGSLALPVDRRCLRIAEGGQGSYVEDVFVGGSHLRILTFGVAQTNAGPVAIQLARPLNSVDQVLRDLRLVLLVVLVAGVFLAGALGRLASRRVLRPLNEVAATAERIGETDDLSQRITVRADDEVGSLATRFNAMLDRLQASRAALDDSMRAQRQLVADASHELRTPVTSLRTNIEILLQTPDLDPEERLEMLNDVVEQSEELSALVNDLIELARGDQPGATADDVRLDRVVATCVDRARRNAPHLTFVSHLQPAQLDAAPERLERAVNNLLDNASRHSPPGGTVDVHAGTDGVIVRDHGSGVEADDLPYLFDRFYRGTNSRGSQGSGLGLAIVRQVTEQLGGTASVANAPDGGAVFTLALPASPPEDASAAESQPQPDVDRAPVS